ncbi:large ribosomal subunit protein mL40 isoform X2 [Hyperolius riggenbachi]
MRAEPKKKKKVDPKREIVARERLKKKLKKMERVAPEFIPIEDFMTTSKHQEESRIRSAPQLSAEEQERRALLLKKWALFKQEEHKVEQRSIESLLESQRKALDELRLESKELYEAAVRCDPTLFPLESRGPCHTAPIPNYNPPDGKYNDITKVYVQQ